MRRMSAGVAVLAACALVGATPASGARFHGTAAKHWAAKIAALGQRPAGGAHERQAGAIVRRRLAALGYDVGVQSIALPNGRRSRNVVGRTDGAPRVLIVAHMDGARGTRAANDNASGVGALLELARVLRGRDRIRFAALGAEERVVTGSRYHLGSRRLVRSFSRSRLLRVRFAVSLDMIGVGTRLHVRGLEAAPNRSARLALRRARALGIRATYLEDTGQSDHAELTRAGLPAAWMQWRWDVCWHEPCDRIRRVKHWKLGKAGRVVLAAARRALD